MKPLRIKEKTPQGEIITDDLPRIVDPAQIMEINDTVLDPLNLETGMAIMLSKTVMDYAGRQIDKVWVPGIVPMIEEGLWVIHPITWMANQILRVVQQVASDQAPEHALQGMISAYQAEAIRELVAKTGLVRTTIVGARIKKSGRAVLVPNANYAPDQIGIPGKFFEEGGLEHLSLVLVGRDPTIHDGSVEVLRARRSPHNVCEVHPLVFEQLGADCDGDQVYWFPVPQDEACQAEAELELLGFCKTYGRWTKQFLDHDSRPAPDWANLKVDTAERMEPTGFSVGPEDVLGGGNDREDNWHRIEKLTGKQLRGDCIKIAEGLTEVEFQDLILQKNHETAAMKLHLGPIGAACNRLKIAAGANPTWLTSANYLSERLQQILLDSKGLTGKYDVFEILAVLNMSGPWKESSVAQAVEKLEEAGLDPEKVTPMITVIYEVYPAAVALEEILPSNAKIGNYMGPLKMAGSSIGIDRIMNTVRTKLTEDGYGRYLTKLSDLQEQHREGLDGIALRFFPLHELISSSQFHHGLAVRVFAENDIDRLGPCRTCWDIAQTKCDG